MMAKVSGWVGALATAALILCGGAAVRATELVPVVLGAIYNLTGSQAGLDIPSSQGARLAVDEANRYGGVLGRPVRLVLEDGESRPEVIAARTAAALADNPAMSALFGLSDTDMVLAAAPVAARHRRLFLTSGATSPLLPAEVPDYLFLACFGDNVQAAAAAEWAVHDLGARTVSVLFNAERAYTRLLHGYFQTRFAELGGRIVSVESYTPETLGPAVDRLGKADVVFVAAVPEDVVEAVRLLRQAGFSVPIVGGDGFDLQNAWSDHPDFGRVYFTTHAYLGADNPDPRVTAFRNAYIAAYPGTVPDAFAALGYDAARLLIAAVAAAGSPDPQAVRDALAGIRHFEGVTGTISYPPGNRIPTKSVTVLEIDNGRRMLVRTLSPTRVPPPW
jgi:branched-chain amino acid transport system substrate-binding protein